jgi:hypothetical protein
MKQSEADALVPTAHANAAAVGVKIAAPTAIRQGVGAEFPDAGAIKRAAAVATALC